MGRDLRLHRLGHEVLALAEAHDVDVVLGEQPQAGQRLGRGRVPRKDVGAVTFDRDFLELVSERVEERTHMGRFQGPRDANHSRKSLGRVGP